MSTETRTNINELLKHADAGVISEKLGIALSLVAMQVVNNDKKGKVVLELDMSRIGSDLTCMIELKTTLKYVYETANSKKNEQTFSKTPFHVGNGGHMTFAPDTQEELNLEEKL